MAKLLHTPLPQPPATYDPRAQATLVRTLNQALARINYTPQSQHIAALAQHWIGL